MEMSAQEAAETLFREKGSQLLRLAALYLGDLQMAEDAVQECYIKVIQGYEKFRGGADLATWGTRILINICKDMRRAAWFRRRQMTLPLEHLPEPAAPMERDDQEVVQQVMALPQKYREAVLLHYWQGLDARQVAYALNTSEGAVYTRLSRARALLKPILEGGHQNE